MNYSETLRADEFGIKFRERFPDFKQSILQLACVEAYAAACEDKREWVDVVKPLKKEVAYLTNCPEVERARSAKLLKGVKEAIESWGIDTIIEEINEAIAEYEAGHD